MAVKGMRWVERGKVLLLEAEPRHYRGSVMQIADKRFAWFVSGTTMQGEARTRRKAQDLVEEQVRRLVFAD